MNRHAAWLTFLCTVLVFSCTTAAWADYGAGQAAWKAGRYAEALRQWRASARKGDRRAMAALGRALVKGVGVPQDFVEAHKWLNLAAARGDEKAAAERDTLAKEMTVEERAEARKLARAWRNAGRRRSTAIVPRRRTPSTPRPPRRVTRKVSPGSAALRAVAAGNISALEKALAAGADPNARGGRRGWTPLMYAADKGYTLLVPPLLKAGAKPNLRAADGATALFIAALHGNSGIVELLMKAGADPRIKGPKGRTAEGLMAARIARKKYGGVKGLHKALRANERLAVIKALLDRSAELGARDVILEPKYPDYKYFYTPLHIAARYNRHPEVIALLLKRGATLNERVKYQYKKESKKNENTTAQQLAAQWNENPKVAMLVIERGGGVNGRDADGNTPLHFAASNKNPELAKLLLDRGIDVNVRNKDGWTPLHGAAAANKNPEVVKLLLDRGADANAKTTKYGYTPLHSLSNNKNPKASKALVKLLIAHGADLRMKAGWIKLNPFEQAVFSKNRAVVSAFPPYERGRLVMRNGRIHIHKQFKERIERKQGAGADAGWFDRRAACFEYNDGGAICDEPLCDAIGLNRYFGYVDKSEIITLLLDQGAKDFLDPRNHHEDNHRFGSRCMFRLIYRMAKKRNRAAIENWMRHHNVDLNILKQKPQSFTSGPDDDNTGNED